MYAIVFRPWIACQLQQNVNNNDSNKMKFIVFDVKLMKCLLRFPFDAPARKKPGNRQREATRNLLDEEDYQCHRLWLQYGKTNQIFVSHTHINHSLACFVDARARSLHFFHSLHILHWTTLQLTVKLHSLQKLMCVCFTVYDTGFRRICTPIYWN